MITDLKAIISMLNIDEAALHLFSDFYFYFFFAVSIIRFIFSNVWI